MATSKTTEEQLADVKRFNEALRTHLKKANEELTTTRNNQHILIDLLADTMKRLREAEAALEEEKKKHSPLATLLHRSDPWRTDVWEAGARACEVLLAGARPLEARAWEARTCGPEPSTEEPSVEVAAAAVAGSSTTEDDDLYA